ncbi:hypothetical protein L6R52_04755 [Myxococcota bacterium]|nr:hypothetical protein [Myxococcota bacterium]
MSLPGTSSVSVGFAPPSACRECHGNFEPESPWETWAGSSMAHAAQDPLFLSAVVEANKDVPHIGDFCLRCHAPAAWLEGRCFPSDGSRLEAEDTGVTCAFCHRMTPAPIRGNGIFLIAEDLDYRGRYADAMAPHHTKPSTYFADSALCGTCHDLWNPLVERRDPVDGTFTGQPFPEQSTYEEWATSAYANGPDAKSCQDCHMPKDVGRVAEMGPVRPDRASHAFAGANAFLPAAIAFLFPGDGLAQQLLDGKARVQATLRTAASLEGIGMPLARRGEPLALTLRVTNLTGHKLPTGYPEGRRVWLEVASTELGLARGAYDAERGEPDDPAAVYQTVHGQYGIGPGHRLALNDTIFEDTRIPPKLMRTNATIAPIGKDYPEVEPGRLAHWDDVVVTATVPCDLAAIEVRVSATLWYQGVTKRYVDALVAENGAHPNGARLAAAFEEADPGPLVITALELFVPVDPSSTCAEPDAGIEAPDAGSPEDAAVVDAARDAAVVVIDAGMDVEDAGGCACSASRLDDRANGGVGLVLGLALVLSFVRRRRFGR